MNKVFLTLALAVLGIAATGQNLLRLTAYPTITDTTTLMEQKFLRSTLTSTGSRLEYINEKGDYAAANIRERGADTIVASSVSIIFSGSAGSIDSILINDVNIIANPVSFNTNITTTVADIEDSIDAQTQSPVVYAAANADSTLTISAPALFGDTANGYTVVVYTTTLTSTTAGVMAGGITSARNLTTISDRLINVTVGGATMTINADRIIGIVKNSSGGSEIWYEGEKFRVITSTTQPDAIQTLIDAL